MSSYIGSLTKWDQCAKYINSKQNNETQLNIDENNNKPMLFLYKNSR